MVSLEDLVPNVLFLVLLNAPNMRILWDFIRVSPRMYRVFRRQRDVILSTAIAREIGCSIMGDAQSALSSSHFEARGLSKAQSLKWLVEYQSGIASHRILSRASLGPEALPLWRMQQDVKFIAELFARDRLHIFDGGFGFLNGAESVSQQDHILDEISKAEKLKIFRAVYRYAIYGNLFHYDSDRPRVAKRKLRYAQEQSHSFLTLFPAWQVEELSCINDFIRDKILKKWQEVENTFYTLLVRDPASWDLDRKDPWNSRWEVDEFFSCHVKVNYHKNWQRHLATVSLPELRELFTAKPAALLRVIRAHGNHWPHDFLTEALLEDPYHSTFITPEYEAQEEALQSDTKVQFGGDAIDQPNEGWLWAHDYKPCELYTLSSDEFPIGEGLRRFGYVFWDSSRFLDSGIPEKDPAEVSQVMLTRFPRPAYLENSVEDRLRQHALS